jgi:hypothetical protein
MPARAPFPWQPALSPHGHFADGQTGWSAHQRHEIPEALCNKPTTPHIMPHPPLSAIPRAASPPPLPPPPAPTPPHTTVKRLGIGPRAELRQHLRRLPCPAAAIGSRCPAALAPRGIACVPRAGARAPHAAGHVRRVALALASLAAAGATGPATGAVCRTGDRVSRKKGGHNGRNKPRPRRAGMPYASQAASRKLVPVCPPANAAQPSPSSAQQRLCGGHGQRMKTQPVPIRFHCTGKETNFTTNLDLLPQRGGRRAPTPPLEARSSPFLCWPKPLSFP